MENGGAGLSEDMRTSTVAVKREISFPFRLGEFSLFTVKAEALVFGGGEETSRCLESDVAAFRARPILVALPRISREFGRIKYVRHEYTKCEIDLTKTWVDYMAHFTSKSRANLLKKVRRFTNRYPGCYAEFDSGSMRQFYDLAREVSAKTYQERLLDAGLPEWPQFAAKNREGAFGFILSAGSRPISYLYAPVEDGTLLYDSLGYDPEFKEYSPGTVLQYLALESIFAKPGLRAFDFGLGDGQHKQTFATTQTRCADIYYFKPAFRWWVLLLSDSGLALFSRGIVKVLDTIGLKRRVKQFFRR